MFLIDVNQGTYTSFFLQRDSGSFILISSNENAKMSPQIMPQTVQKTQCPLPVYFFVFTPNNHYVGAILGTTLYHPNAFNAHVRAIVAGTTTPTVPRTANQPAEVAFWRGWVEGEEVEARHVSSCNESTIDRLGLCGKWSMYLRSLSKMKEALCSVRKDWLHRMNDPSDEGGNLHWSSDPFQWQSKGQRKQ